MWLLDEMRCDVTGKVMRSVMSESQGRVSIIIIIVYCNSQWIKFITWFEELSSLGAVGQLTPVESPDAVHTQRPFCSRVDGYWRTSTCGEIKSSLRSLLVTWTDLLRLLGESTSNGSCWCGLSPCVAGYRWYTCPVSRRNVWCIVTYGVKL